MLLAHEAPTTPMSMVFGHAPIILPAVLRVPLPYHPLFYVHLALLHASLEAHHGDVTLLFAARARSTTRPRCWPGS